MGWFLSKDARFAVWAWEKRALWARQWAEWFALCKRRPVG